MPNLPWKIVEKSIKRLREMSMWQWTYYSRLKNPWDNHRMSRGYSNHESIKGCSGEGGSNITEKLSCGSPLGWWYMLSENQGPWNQWEWQEPVKRKVRLEHVNIKSKPGTIMEKIRVAMGEPDPETAREIINRINILTGQQGKCLGNMGSQQG